MSDPSNHPVRICLRVPAAWKSAEEMLAKLAGENVQLSPGRMVLADGSEFTVDMFPPDPQFPGIFTQACRQPLTESERTVVDNYQVNLVLSGTGGSLPAAHSIMKAAAVFIRAGAAGAFCDNSLLAHGGSQWIDLMEDGSPDALSYAFIGIVGRDHEIETVGMHTLGLPEIKMRRKDNDPVGDERNMIEVIRYVAQSEKELAEGHVIADLDGPRFHVANVQRATQFQEGPMFNPHGCLQLISMREIAENN